MFIVTVISLSACGNDDNTDSKTLSYKIIKKGGEYFIQVSGEPLPKIENSCVIPLPVIEFDSIHDMKEKVTKYQLDEEDIDKMLYSFPKSENNDIPILDIYNPYIPRLPGDLKINAVEWYGKNYMAELIDLQLLIRGSIIIYYDENLGHPSSEMSFKEEMSYFSHTVEKTHSDDRNSDIYTFSYADDYTVDKWKCVCYSLVNPEAGENFEIEEDYILVSDTDWYRDYVSDEIPYCVRIYGTTEYGKFEVVIRRPHERPSVEWLTSFGIQKYSEKVLNKIERNR